MLKKRIEKWLDKGKWNEHKWRRKLRIDLAWGLVRLLGAKPCRKPIFILGCGHSGTSLVLRILGEHSALYAVPYESRCGESRAPDTVYRKFDTLTHLHHRRRWVEKTPGNVRYLEQLLERFPEGQFLLIIRDGRDVASSLKKRGNTLEEGIDRWINDNRIGEQFWNHPRVMKFTYEALVAQSDATIESILRFLDEPYEEAVKNFHERPRAYYSKDLNKPTSENEADHLQYRNWQINQPIFDGRGKWKKELSGDEVALIEKRAGDMLRAYGYPPEK